MPNSISPFYFNTMDINYTIETKDVLLGMIKRHNEEYRKGMPTISDQEYEALVARLKEIDPENDWFKRMEPAPVSDRRKVALPIPMKSLNKVKNIAEFTKWYKSLGLTGSSQVVCMPKFDGLSLLYDEITGMAYSRGGTENEGQDCSTHCKASGITLSENSFHYTFGEFVFSREQWKKFKNDNQGNTEEVFKSPRNTAAGLLNRDEPCSHLQYVSFFRYGIDTNSLHKFSSFEEVIEDICNTFHQLHLYQKLPIKNVNEAYLMELFKIWSVLFPIDGIVIYINDLALWETIGRHQTTGNPLYAIAYKHPDFTDSFETTVKDITWKVSKAGALKPVVNIEAVNTGDCNMENPTGYNAGWINDNEIAKGAKILVTRSGGVIPKILETLTPASDMEQHALWDKLAECPHCGHPTAWNQNHIELCCTNPQCSGIQLAKIVFFYTICEAENMGEETLSKIYNAGFTSIKQVLNITFDELMQIDGFAEGLSDIILENNHKIMAGVDMATLMHASDCFVGIGKIKAQKILDDMDELVRRKFYERYYVALSPSEPAFLELPKTQQNFILGVPAFFKFLYETQIPVLSPVQNTTNQEGKCAGLNVCMSGFRDAALEDTIKKEGGKIASGVSKNTTHLVVKDKNATSSKISKAQSINIPIYDINEFLERYIN